MHALATDAAMIARVVTALPAYLRRPFTLAEAEGTVRERLAARAPKFLAFAREAIFANPSSPYRSLLRAAGCEAGDLERLVRQEGVEGALRALSRAGVFVTVDEFKGRQPIVRGSTSFPVAADDFRNPLSVAALWTSTGGSRGPPARVQLDLACVRDRAINMNVALGARGGAAWRTAVWGLRGIVPLLWYSARGEAAARWFTQVDAFVGRERARFRWSVRTLLWESRLLGVPLPAPEYAPVADPSRILRWLAATLAHGEVPHLWGAPSAVVRLVEAATAAGADIAGAQFTITGEPITAPRLALIRRAGATAMPDYGSVESGGTVAYGCLAPVAPDDMHVFSDLNAVIAADVASLPVNTLLVSSLLDTSPFVLLNVSMGDRGVLGDRSCGCPMQKLGWGSHLQDVRSFEKLSVGGVTFADTAVVTVLEDLLPARFGGGPTDYQLIEDAGPAGEPTLRLLVHPRVGTVDPAAVREAFLAATGAMGEVQRDMADHWHQSGILEVSREPPYETGTGKILHLVGTETHGAHHGR